jgi:hypothetical protein
MQPRLLGMLKGSGEHGSVRHLTIYNRRTVGFQDSGQSISMRTVKTSKPRTRATQYGRVGLCQRNQAVVLL